MGNDRSMLHLTYMYVCSTKRYRSRRLSSKSRVDTHARLHLSLSYLDACEMFPPPPSSSALNKTNNDTKPIRKERIDHSLASSPFQETSEGNQQFSLNQSASRPGSDTKETFATDCPPSKNTPPSQSTCLGNYKLWNGSSGFV